MFKCAVVKNNAFSLLFFIPFIFCAFMRAGLRLFITLFNLSGRHLACLALRHVASSASEYQKQDGNVFSEDTWHVLP